MAPAVQAAAVRTSMPALTRALMREWIIERLASESSGVEVGTDQLQATAAYLADVARRLEANLGAVNQVMPHEAATDRLRDVGGQRLDRLEERSG